MKGALYPYLHAAARGADHRAAVQAAAEALAERPWDVVMFAGALARASRRVAEHDLGLTADLEVVAPHARNAIVAIETGQPFPAFDSVRRKRSGAFDTPAELARRVVRATLRQVEGVVSVGLDPACGTGAFLLAMREHGVPEIHGTDLDEVALAVAAVAVPGAHLSRKDALEHGPLVDVVCGNPPFVPPEHQDKELRLVLRRRFPWLRGRFDLVVPFAATAVGRVRPGGAAGLVLPFPALVQPYGSSLRRRWLQRHRIATLVGPMPFPGADVEVGVVVVQAESGPAELPSGLSAAELLRLENVPLDPALSAGDVDLVEAVRQRSVPLGSLAWIDTGVVAHGPGHGKASLLHRTPGPGRVPYADARQFFAGERLWLEYQPAHMHRPKSPALFESPKVVVQRLRGRGPVRAAVDRSGIYVGHTCTVVVPRDERLDVDRLCALITHPLMDGFVRIERGRRLDLYPRDVSSIPVPTGWLQDSTLPLERALGLNEVDLQRLLSVGARG